MLLQDRIAAVETVGRDLLEALTSDDLTACQNLIEERGRLLAELASARETASQHELQRCQAAMQELAHQDATLREQFDSEQAQLGSTRDSLLGRHGASGHPSPYRQTDPTCLDRKA